MTAPEERTVETCVYPMAELSDGVCGLVRRAPIHGTKNAARQLDGLIAIPEAHPFTPPADSRSEGAEERKSYRKPHVCEHIRRGEKPRETEWGACWFCGDQVVYYDSPEIARMPLWCPRCRAPHLDVGEWEFRPHRTHQCLECGQQFRIEGQPTAGIPAPAPSSADRPDLLSLGAAVKASNLSDNDKLHVLTVLMRADRPSADRERAHAEWVDKESLKKEISARLAKHWNLHGWDACDCIKDLVRDGLIPNPHARRTER